MGSSLYRGVVLGMLLVVYIFNFIDRQILSILAEPIRRDLGLNDLQMGLLGGIAFATLYSTMAIPLAAVADRSSRRWVITVSLAVWSGFTALCSLATGFWHLFLSRLGVGVGEAGGIAPSYALIADYFPPSARSRAIAIYSLGIPLGGAAGVLFGGYIAATVDWRAAFLVVGLSGFLIAPVFMMVVRDPTTTRLAVGISVWQVFATLSAKRSFWLLALGAAASSMLGYGLAFWIPALLQRSFGLGLVDTSRFFAGVLLVGGTIGMLGGGYAADWLGGRDRRWHARLPALAFLMAVPLFAAAILSSDRLVAFLLFLIPQALAYVWISPVISAVQNFVQPAMRATASAIFLLINNLVGAGLGTVVLGALSDWLAPRFGADALRLAMLSSLSLYLLAALLMWLAATSLRQDWIDEPST